MQTALVLLVIVVAALAFRRRLLLVAVAAISAWVLIPGAAGGSVTGIAGLHPASVLILASFVVEVVNPKALLRQAINDHRPVYLSLTVFLVLSAAFTFRLGSGGTMTFVNVLLAPILLFALIDAARVQQAVRPVLLVQTIVTLGCLEAVLGLIQATIAQNIFWVSQLTQYTWYSAEFNRAQGTLDHPILLGVVCAACIPLTGTFKRMSVTTVACVLLTLGVIVSQTRSAIPAAAIGLLAIVVFSNTGAVRRFLFGIIVVAASAIALNSSLASALLGRVSGDGGSTDLRDSAYSWFAANWSEYFWKPGGYGSSFTTAAHAGLASSFESSPIIFYLDFGALAVVLFFGSQLVIGVRGLWASRQAALLSTGALVAVVLPFTSSVYGWVNSGSTLTWALLALVVLEERSPVDPRHRETWSPATHPWRREPLLPGVAAAPFRPQLAAQRGPIRSFADHADSRPREVGRSR